MIALSIAVLGVFIGQPDDGAREDLPYRILLRSSGEWIHAFVEESEWQKPRMSVVLDEPWLPEDERRRSVRKLDIEEYYREVSSTRTRRIENGWIERGYQRVETANGELDWVHADEIAFAERAREMEAAAFPETGPADLPEITVEGMIESGEPGFAAQWGAHLAVASAALVLSVIVVWAVWLR